MEAFLIYIIKASGILILFHAAYELLLKKETFFHINRVFLLTGLLMSMVLPSIVIENYRVLPVSELTAYPIQGSADISENGLVASSVNLIGIVQTIFFIGFGVMVFRIIVQLMSIRRLIRINRLIKVPGFTLVEMQKETGPFFFLQLYFLQPKTVLRRGTGSHPGARKDSLPTMAFSGYIDRPTPPCLALVKSIELALYKKHKTEFGIFSR